MLCPPRVFIVEDFDAAFDDTSRPVALEIMMQNLHSTNLSKELSVSLRVIAASLRAQSAGLSFQCGRDGETIDCGVAGDVLRDLLTFHQFDDSGEDPFRALLPEIERLANAKSDAGRFEEDGALVIRAVDLLRYGFQAKSRASRSAA